MEDIFIGARTEIDRGFDGFIDELRISKVARYTSNYTVQASQFVNDENTLLLMHMEDASDDNTLIVGNVLGDLKGDIKNADGTVIFEHGDNNTTPSFPKSLKVIGEIAMEEDYSSGNHLGTGFDARLFIHNENVIFATEANPSNLDTQKNAGTRNTIMGYQALSYATAGLAGTNTVIGGRACVNFAEGSHNVAIGSKAGEQTNVKMQSYDGNFNTWIGTNTGPTGLIGTYRPEEDPSVEPSNPAALSSEINYAIAIGYNVKATADYECRIGTSSHNVVIPGTLDVTGATTFKTTIQSATWNGVLSLTVDGNNSSFENFKIDMSHASSNLAIADYILNNFRDNGQYIVRLKNTGSNGYYISIQKPSPPDSNTQLWSYSGNTLNINDGETALIIFRHIDSITYISVEKFT
jgi:hypothetical protein